MQFGVNKHEYIFFKDNKIARARRASAICSLKNLQVLITPNCRRNHVITCYNVHYNVHYKCLLHQIAGGIMLLLVAMYIVLQLCTCVITLRSCYIRMYSFSANQKHVIFLCTLLIKLFIWNTYSDSIRVKLFV